MTRTEGNENKAYRFGLMRRKSTAHNSRGIWEIEPNDTEDGDRREANTAFMRAVPEILEWALSLYAQNNKLVADHNLKYLTLKADLREENRTALKILEEKFFGTSKALGLAQATITRVQALANANVGKTIPTEWVVEALDNTREETIQRIMARILAQTPSAPGMAVARRLAEDIVNDLAAVK